jgi:hypothetical protein
MPSTVTVLAGLATHDRTPSRCCRFDVNVNFI